MMCPLLRVKSTRQELDGSATIALKELIEEKTFVHADPLRQDLQTNYDAPPLM